MKTDGKHRGAPEGICIYFLYWVKHVPWVKKLVYEKKTKQRERDLIFQKL